MPRAALSLAYPDRIAVFPLSDDRASIIGRSSDAAVSLASHPTVSRQHASLRPSDGGFALAHLSQTNPTLLNGERVGIERMLDDGNVIEIGDARLIFHDLARAALAVGPTCHHCGRQNPAGQFDCWHCGSALVNAATAVGLAVRCRLVAADGGHHDLSDGSAVAFTANGLAQPASASDRPLVAVRPASVELLVAADTPVELNGQSITSDAQLSNGDQLRVGGRLFASIIH